MVASSEVEGAGEGDADPVGDVEVGRGVQHGEVGARAHGEVADVVAFVRRASELGYEAVEINHSMTAGHAGAIMGYGSLPVTGVHAPAPLERHPSAGWNRELNLAALDETERALAVQYHVRSIELAAQAGTTQVIVHLAAVIRGRSAGEFTDANVKGTRAVARAARTLGARLRQWGVPRDLEAFGPALARFRTVPPQTACMFCANSRTRAARCAPPTSTACRSSSTSG